MANTGDEQGVPTYDAVVVGAGFGGLYATWRLLSDGLTVRAFEGSNGVGGVWQWNRYPGAQTDSPQEAYRLTFDGDPLSDWVFSRRFPPQPEVLGYLDHVADRFDLRRHFSFLTQVTAAHYDDRDSSWLVTTDTGERVRASYLVTAVGAVSEPVRPNIPGFDSYQGRILYTSQWPQESVDLSGQRIGLIGTGSSGVQVLPHLAAEGGHVTVFQRTPNFVVPTGNREVTEEDRLELLERFDDVQRRVRAHPAGFPFERAVGRLAVETPEEERRRIFDEAWVRGGFSFLYEGFDDVHDEDDANLLAADYIRGRISEIVEDPAVAASLMPTHQYGSKRPPTGDTYFHQFNQPHVDLVDLSVTPILTFTETGIRTAAGDVGLDVVVLATGFDIGVGSYNRIDIRGRGGRRLSDHWANGPSTLLGVAVTGFPNLFMVSGPHSAFANVPPGVVHEGTFIAGLIAHMRATGIDAVEARADAEWAWNAHVVDAAGEELIEDAVKANSWLVGANLEGRDPVVTVYLGGHDAYLDQLDRESAAGYPSFEPIAEATSRQIGRSVHDVSYRSS